MKAQLNTNELDESSKLVPHKLSILTLVNAQLSIATNQYIEVRKNEYNTYADDLYTFQWLSK